MPSTPSDGKVRRICRECGAAVELSGLVAYCSLGPWDLCDTHYAEWCRANLNQKDSA